MRCDERHRRPPRRGDLQSQRFAAQHGRRQVRERDARQQRAVPRAHRPQDREQPVVEVRSGEDQQPRSRDGRAAGSHPAARGARAVLRRRERGPAGASCCRHLLPPRGARARRESRDLERAAQRARAQRLLALDRRGDALPRRAPLEAPRVHSTTATSAASTSSQTRNGTGRGSAIQRALPSADAPSASTRQVAPTARAMPTQQMQPPQARALAVDQICAMTVMASGGS